MDVHRLGRYRLSWLPPAKFLASRWEWQTVLEPQGLMPEAVLACSCLENVLIWTGIKARIQFNSWVWCCETEGWWCKVEGSFSMLSASHVRSSWRLANEELLWQPLALMCISSLQIAFCYEVEKMVGKDVLSLTTAKGSLSPCLVTLLLCLYYSGLGWGKPGMGSISSRMGRAGYGSWRKGHSLLSQNNKTANTTLEKDLHCGESVFKQHC